MPDIALDLSRGCGNPTGFANLQPGEVVVDLGCGGGIDVILASRKVEATGRVVGVDFAPQMIERAKQAVSEAGLQGADIELRVAGMEQLTLPDGFADVAISNCVINLCPDKTAVYGEAFRILRPGGRMAISDVVLTEGIDVHLRQRFQSMWAGCLGGALPEADYFQVIRNAGFADVQIVARHVLSAEELEAMAGCPGEEFAPAPATEDLAAVGGKVMSIKFKAVKPLLTEAEVLPSTSAAAPRA